MAIKLPQSVKKILEDKAYGHVITTNQDGRPQVTMVWMDVDGDEVLFNTAEGRLKPKNLRRDPRVIVSVQDRNDPQAYMVIHGKATVSEAGADAAHRQAGQALPGRRQVSVPPAWREAAVGADQGRSHRGLRPQDAALDVAVSTGGPLTRRWTEQRWLLDNIIRSVGMDWDQPRSIYLSVPDGLRGERRLRRRSASASRSWPTPRRPSRRWRAGARARRRRPSRTSIPSPPATTTSWRAIHWGAAQWPLDENNEQNRFYNGKKRECYTKYAKLADHHVEAAWIPFRDGKSLPAWFHLPPGYRGGRIPVVVIAVPAWTASRR